MPAAVIGLEVHLAVATDSKLFCGCPADGFGVEPNRHVCPVCVGLPGALPVANAHAIELATRFVLALGCEVPDRTGFHRKHYVYPDAPKNYQISQFGRPLGRGGHLDVPGHEPVRIASCHLEEDAGRLVHPTYAPYSLVDLNRAGAPLIELVSEPVIRGPEHARAFLQEVQALARALRVSDASPEQGKMRADVNVSLRAEDGSFGTKVEVKNLNSFRSVEAALRFEIRRQARLLEDGVPVAQETRGWNEGGQKTVAQRGKEGEADYRYLSDPDLPEFLRDQAELSRIRAETPETPAAKRVRYAAAGVREGDAHRIASDAALSDLFDAVAKRFPGPAQAVANLLVSEVAGLLRAEGRDFEGAPLPAAPLATLLQLGHDGTIASAAVKQLLPDAMAGGDVPALVQERGLARVADEGALATLVDQVMAANPEVVASARQEPKAIDALVGRAMRQSGGSADPQVVRRLLQERLAAED